jgi:hypothetical protein
MRFLIVMRLTQNRPAGILAQICVKAEEVERLWFTQTPPPIDGATPPTFDQSRLVRMQLQAELRQPFASLVSEPPRIVLVLKPDGVLVSEAHDHHLAGCPVTSPPVGPQVEHARAGTRWQAAAMPMLPAVNPAHTPTTVLPR